MEVCDATNLRHSVVSLFLDSLCSPDARAVTCFHMFFSFIVLWQGDIFTVYLLHLVSGPNHLRNTKLGQFVNYDFRI